MGKAAYDFAGWATRNNLKCADGRTIRANAFADQDGQVVPLVWNHQHNDPYNVLGHALLKNEKDGVRCYATFNDTEQGRNAKALVDSGDITSLSIFANQLKQKGGDVLHGAIREVSLVLAGANPGAYIDSVSFAHGEESEDEAIIYNEEELELAHADAEPEKKEEEKPMAEVEEKKTPAAESSDETVKDVFDTLNEKQKTVVYALIGEAIKQAKEGGEGEESDEEDEEMKHNIFEGAPAMDEDVLSHSDEEEIIELAKNPSVQTLKNAMQIFEDNNSLQHDAVASGFATADVSKLFPEYQDIRPGAPELITYDQGWVNSVMSKVSKSPISRVRTQQVDIRGIDALRAKGYAKGKEKKLAGNFNLVRRTTDPQTIYVRTNLNRDDIVDITDFDYVQYLYNINRIQLNEELATAIMLGDGRDEGDADKISAEHIRPIWLDDELYTIHKDIDKDAVSKELAGTQSFAENYVYAEGMINTLLYAMEGYKGTGTPDMFITPHMLNVMLLARDLNGRRVYASKAELAQALNVGNIFTCEQFDGKTRTTSDAKKKEIKALIVNLHDYNLGSTKGGEVSHFTQFDIDFNQEKSLLETRVSGALTRIKSAIAIEEDVTAQG